MVMVMVMVMMVVVMMVVVMRVVVMMVMAVVVVVVGEEILLYKLDYAFLPPYLLGVSMLALF